MPSVSSRDTFNTCVAASAYQVNRVPVDRFRLNELVTGGLTFRIRGEEGSSQAVDAAPNCSRWAKSETPIDARVPRQV